MRRAILLAILAGSLPLANAAAQECPPRQGNPSVETEDRTTPVKYDFTRTAEEIRLISPVPVDPNVIERGLTVTRLEYGLKINFEIWRLRNGMSCVRPRSVTLSIGFPATTVYIQRDYGYNSCQTRAILKHENTHVSNAWDSLRKYMPSILDALRTAASRASIVSADPEEAKKTAFNQMADAVTSWIDVSQNEQHLLDQRLDSPASIQMTTDSCPAW